MRTTVTFDKDVERLLRDKMHRSRKSFRQTLNAALRKGLAGNSGHPNSKIFVVEARPMGLRTDIDPTGFNKLADDLEADSFVKKQARVRRR